jgi:hypothetical protein
LHHRMRGGGAHGWKHRRQRVFGRAGTLLGPEGAAVRLVSSFRVRAWSYTVHALCVGSGGDCVGSGFGGVFVNWIVDASI